MAFSMQRAVRERQQRERVGREEVAALAELDRQRVIFVPRGHCATVQEARNCDSILCVRFREAVRTWERMQHKHKGEFVVEVDERGLRVARRLSS